MSLQQYSELATIMEPIVHIGPPSCDFTPYIQEALFNIKKPTPIRINQLSPLKIEKFKRQQTPALVNYPTIKPIFLNPCSEVKVRERYNSKSDIFIF